MPLNVRKGRKKILELIRKMLNQMKFNTKPYIYIYIYIMFSLTPLHFVTHTLSNPIPLMPDTPSLGLNWALQFGSGNSLYV